MPVSGGSPLSHLVLCQLLCPFVLFPPTLVLGMTVDSILVLVGGGPAMGTDVGGLPCVVAAGIGIYVGGGLLVLGGGGVGAGGTGGAGGTAA